MQMILDETLFFFRWNIVFFINRLLNKGFKSQSFLILSDFAFKNFSCALFSNNLIKNKKKFIEKHAVHETWPKKSIKCQWIDNGITDSKPGR